MQKTNTFQLLMQPLILTLVFFFDELLLKYLTSGGPWIPQLGFIFLFSMLYGTILWLITYFPNHPKLRHWIRTILVLAAAVGFLVSFFVYKQFKIFYDLTAMSMGAGDALGSFQNDIKIMLLSPDGMAAILLYALPVIAYARFGNRFDKMKDAGVWPFVTAVILAAAALFGNNAWIRSTPAASSIYTNEYSYPNAINQFGLMTAVRLDLTRSANRQGTSFEIAETDTEYEEPEYTPPPSDAPISYGTNKLALNFKELAQNGSSLEASLDEYVSTLKASSKNEYTGLFEGKNLIMICAEAFSGDLLDSGLFPTLSRMAEKGIQFKDYYQPASAGTTGGEYEVIFGMLPTNSGASFKMTANYNNLMTMGSQLDRLGYNGWAFHNNSYLYYDRNLTHVNIGYSNGFMGIGNGMEEFVESNWPESDLEMINGTVPLYIDAQPFNVYYMTVSGHSGYDFPNNMMSRKNRDRVEDLPYSDRVKGYYACNLELEDAMTSLLAQLEEKGILDDTVIVLTADHFPYGLDNDAALGHMPYLSEFYGYDVTNYLQRDHNRLIIWSGCLEDMDPIVVNTPVSSLDILPTLSNLFGTEFDSRVFPGRDVFSDATPLVFNINYDWKTPLGTYYANSGTFVPNSESTVIPDGYVDKIRAIVRNKINYCYGAGDTDYMDHVFGSYFDE